MAGGWLETRLRARAARLWSGIAARAPHLERAEARRLREEARALQRDLRAVLRATSPRAQAAADNLSALPLPSGTDWRWRPTILTTRLWRLGWAGPGNGARLGQEMRVWHDGGPDAPAILRQVPAIAATDLAPFALTIETMAAGLGYLSMSIDLPPEARAGLHHGHILRLEMSLRAEAAQDLTLRLNLRNGPNTDVVWASIAIPVGRDPEVRVVAFDLATNPFDAGRMEGMWIDLVMERPAVNAVELRDMILSRHPRAAM